MKVGREVAVEVSVGTREAVLVGINVSVGTKTVTTCSVSAAEVLKLETAKSIIFSGATVIRTWLFKSLIAIVETLQSRLKPITPAVKTPSGPTYSLTLTLLVLLVYTYRWKLSHKFVSTQGALHNKSIAES